MSSKQLLSILCLAVFLSGCQSENVGLTLMPGWKTEVLVECADDRPDMLMLSGNGQYLYQSCETSENLLAPSLARIDLASGKRDILLYGLERADGLKLAPDGSLWLGEEAEDGLIWRIQNPDAMEPGQRVDRRRLVSSNDQIQPLMTAGRFAHEGLAFSADGRFAYLADEWEEGCVYRFTLESQQLQVMHEARGWLSIPLPTNAREEAEKLHGRFFSRIEDMERLPDDRILMAETGTGRILVLNDRGIKPTISTFLQHADLRHPDNLKWDASRNWLWITDDNSPSILWAWDGKSLHQIARYRGSVITGLESGPDGSIYINLQYRWFRPALTLRLYESS